MTICPASFPRPVSLLVRVFVYLENSMNYFVYLDEFGHIGPFLSRNDPKHKTSPIFGLGGIAIPSAHVRSFSMFFYKLKVSLLDFDLQRSQCHPAKWEKKGSDLYTIRNILKYKELRNATSRLINQIKTIGGFAFFYGQEKRAPQPNFTPEGLYLATLRDAIKSLDNYLEPSGATFSLFLDAMDSHDPGAKRKFRLQGIETASRTMFGNSHCHRLLEPPYQLESHLYQNLQCADWFCGLFGRRYAYLYSPNQYADYECVEKYFGARLDSILKANRMKRNKTARVITRPNT